MGGAFAEAQNALSGQAQKVIFKLNKYLYKFTYIIDAIRVSQAKAGI